MTAMRCKELENDEDQKNPNMNSFDKSVNLASCKGDASHCSMGIVNEAVDGYDLNEARCALLTRVAESDAYFKQQLINDPDLTFSEKFTIASDLLDRKPSTFLERYGRYLFSSDLKYFDQFRGDYTVDFHLLDLNKRLGCNGNDKKKIKNRRYEAMKHLIMKGEYFSDEEMKKRDPLLFEEMIGQYQTNEDVAGDLSNADLSLSEVLLRHLQAVQNNELYDQQKIEREMVYEVEREDENDEVDDGMMESDGSGKHFKEKCEATDKEKLLLRNEFVEIMQQRFLNGQDLDFNYCEVDNSEEYDSFEIFNQDAEDQYFAAESSDNDFDDNKGD